MKYWILIAAAVFISSGWAASKNNAAADAGKSPEKASENARADRLEKTVGKELARGLIECPAILDTISGYETKLKTRTKDEPILKFIKEMEGQLDRYAAAYDPAITARQDPGAAALHDAFLVYGAQGKQAVSLILQGMKKNSDSLVVSGTRIAELAGRDLLALRQDAYAAAGIEKPSEKKKKQIFKGNSWGLTGSWSKRDTNSYGSLAFSVGMPLYKMFDHGAEFSYNNYSDGIEATTTIDIRYLIRMNIPVKIVVWYIGMNIPSTVYTSAKGEKDPPTVGTDLGLLLFGGRKVALNIQLRNDFGSYTQQTVSIGVRWIQ
ncbi:hypothetical protein ACFL5V_06295 [Fibrobacterota bacterium]